MSQFALSRLVDALASVQSDLRALRAEERQLQAAILAARPNGPVSGGAHVLTLRRTRVSKIDPAKLSPQLRAAPEIWATHEDVVFDIARVPPQPRRPLATVLTRAELRGTW